MFFLLCFPGLDLKQQELGLFLTLWQHHLEALAESSTRQI